MTGWAMSCALSDDERWQAFEGALNQGLLRVYDLNPGRVRHDGTTASGYWTVTPEGLFQSGHSKAHRPDLPQLKIMLPALDPLGLPVVTQMVSGERADDPLYLPAIAEAQRTLGRHGLLHVGDCKMAALATRAFVQATQDFHLCPLAETQLPPAELEPYLAPIWTGAQGLTAVYRDAKREQGKRELVAEGYERIEPLTAVGKGKTVIWRAGGGFLLGLEGVTMTRDFESLVLAALLYDLGEIWNTNDLPLVVAIKSSQALNALLQSAHMIACGGVDGLGNPERLRSVFSLLQRDEKKTVASVYLAPASLQPTSHPTFDGIFARTGTNVNRADLLKHFRDAVMQVESKTASAGSEVRLNHLAAVLQGYGWSLPIHAETLCLYDHARLCAALAACLYRYHEKNLDAQTIDRARDIERFQLAVGDLSGIQNYIFGIAEPVGAGQVAKRLRARSFYVAMLSEAVSHALAHDFDVPLINVLMSSGGKFYVLVPNIENAEDKFRAFEQRAAGWLFKEFNGEIGINLAWKPLTGLAFGASTSERTGFGEVMRQLASELGKKKKQAGQPIWQEASSWREDAFVIETNYEGRNDCIGCHKFSAKAQSKLCPQCDLQARLGGRLTRARAITFYRGGAAGEDDLPMLNGYRVSVLTDDHASGDPYLVVRLNAPDLSAYTQYPATFRYLANHIPRGANYEPLSFGEIAEKAKGRDLLGYIKADMDRLGATFAEGLRRDGSGGHDSAANVMHLSRALDLFFSGWLEHTLSRDFPNFYTVFSGGDDVFVLGPWDKALELAQTVNGKLTEYVANPELTLSAGILYAKSGYPIARAAEDVEDVLDESKKQGRNKLTVLGDTLRWEQTPMILEQIRMFEGFNEETLRSGFLNRLVQYSQMYQESKDAGKTQAARFEAHFAYMIARNVRAGNPDLLKWADSLLENLFQDKPSEIMEHLGLIARSVLFKRRTRR